MVAKNFSLNEASKKSLLAILLISSLLTSLSSSSTAQAQNRSHQEDSGARSGKKKKAILCCLGITGSLILAGGGTAAAVHFLGNSDDSENSPGDGSGLNSRPTEDGNSPEFFTSEDLPRFEGLSQLESVDKNQISVFWEPLNEPGLSDKDVNYQLHYSQKEKFSKNSTDWSIQRIAGGDSYDLSGLDPDTLYHFRIFAFLPSGEEIAGANSLVNSTKTVNVSQVLSSEFETKNLEEMGFERVSIDQNTKTLTLFDPKDANELPEIGQVLLGSSIEGYPIVCLVEGIDDQGEKSLKITYSQPALSSVYQDFHSIGQIATAAVGVSESPADAFSRRRLTQVSQKTPRVEGVVDFPLEADFAETVIGGRLRGRYMVGYELLIKGGKVLLFEVKAQGELFVDIEVDHQLTVGSSQTRSKKMEPVDLGSKNRGSRNPLGKCLVEISLFSEAAAEGQANLQLSGNLQARSLNHFRYTDASGPVLVANTVTFDSKMLPSFAEFQASLSASLGVKAELGFFVGPLSAVSSEYIHRYDATIAAESSDEELLASGLLGEYTVNQFDLGSQFEIKTISDLAPLFTGGNSRELGSTVVDPRVLFSLPELSISSSCAQSSGSDEGGAINFELGITEGKNHGLSVPSVQWLAWGKQQGVAGQQSVLVSVSSEELASGEKSPPLRVFAVADSNVVQGLKVVGATSRSATELCLDPDDDEDQGLVDPLEEANGGCREDWLAPDTCCPKVAIYGGGTTENSYITKWVANTPCSEIWCLESCGARSFLSDDLGFLSRCYTSCGCTFGDNGRPTQEWCGETSYRRWNSRYGGGCGWTEDCSGGDYDYNDR